MLKSLAQMPPVTCLNVCKMKADFDFINFCVTELSLAKDIRGNRESFYKYFNDKKV